MKTSKHTLTLEDAAAFTGYSPGTMQKYSKHPPKWGPPAPHVMGKNPGPGPKTVRLYSEEELSAWLEIREKYLADRDAHRAQKKTDYGDLTGIIGRQASELLEAQMAVKAAHRKIKKMKDQTRTIDQLRAEVEQLKAKLQKRPQTTRRGVAKTAGAKAKSHAKEAEREAAKAEARAERRIIEAERAAAKAEARAERRIIEAERAAADAEARANAAEKRAAEAEAQLRARSTQGHGQREKTTAPRPDRRGRGQRMKDQG